MTTETVLSDDQREALYEGHLEAYLISGDKADAIIKSIEQAVLQSPEVQRLREAQQWISIDDRLPPDDDTEIVAVYSANELEIVWGRLIHETYADRPYSHWMPLPPPPQHDNE